MIKNESFSITGANGRLMAADITYHEERPGAPLIIFVHGFKGFKDWGTHALVARFFAENGYRFLKFNFSHNGVTENQPTEITDLIAFGENTPTIELEDLQQVISFVKSGAAIQTPSQIILLGHSLGGGISIITAAEDARISGLITMASVSSFRNLWPKEAEKDWHTRGFIYMTDSRTGNQLPLKSTLLDDLDKNSARLNILAKAASVNQPWLIIHGTADQTVPISNAQDLKRMQPNAELIIMPNTGHTFGAVHPYPGMELPLQLLDLCKKGLRFLKDNLSVHI
ncbi:alpha/beta hydrolase [Mucilaginibacter sp. RS28]|uniref:Alpha/beta hydrolase n=1 Tax=Mucilaginibacter straminoryzae TaxID=2932774 RepID=A0A9X1X320_9SPHI|nr:alpha/beta hydrolase [Mucilaginibacter straminoryzae]MCJ8209450.1 alpha/beta hydrolase [Mucilaginibacter straminoryzae]